MEEFKNYLADITDEIHRTRMREILFWVESTFPGIHAKMAWNQPMFTDHGTFIIGFSRSKQHIAVSPEAKGIEVFSQAIVKSGYSHGSNIFRIKWSESVDYLLLDNMIQYNLEDKKNCSTFWRK